MVSRLLVLGCIACGRIGFDAAGDASDASIDAPWPTGPFGPVSPVDALNSGLEEDDVSLTGDMLEICFDSRRNATTAAAWCSKRASVADAWPAPVEIPELGPANNPRLARDGLSIYLTKNNLNGDQDVWFSRRPDRDSQWSLPVQIPGANSANDDFEPWLSIDERVLYVTTLPPTGPNGIARAERTSASEPFGPVEFVAPLSTSAYDGGTWVREDELLLFYHSDVSGGRDIFTSSRASTADPWSAPVPVAELNTTTADSDVWLSPDGHTIYFISRRNGNDDVFMATR